MAGLQQADADDIPTEARNGSRTARRYPNPLNECQAIDHSFSYGPSRLLGNTNHERRAEATTKAFEHLIGGGLFVSSDMS